MTTDPAPTATNLWHGYSLADIDHLGRLTISIDRWPMHGTLQERLDAVRFAITEHLLTATSPPTRRELVDIGLRAANDYVRTEMRHHGYDRDHSHLGRGAGTNFQRYWQANPRTTAEDRITENLALAQIWPRLVPVQQQALWALAITDDYQAAADMLGINVSALYERLKKARRRFTMLWHEHETPRRRGQDMRVLARSGMYRGRPLLTVDDVERLRDRREEGASFKELAAETGYSVTTVRSLVNGKRRAFAGPIPAAA